MTVKGLGDKQLGHSPNLCLSLFCAVYTEHLELLSKGIRLQDWIVMEIKDVGLTYHCSCISYYQDLC